MKSVFTDKQSVPQDSDLRESLSAVYDIWQTLVNYVYSKYPAAIPEWNFSKSSGWSFRMKDKKRTVIYLLPRAGFFKVALVFGQKATDELMNSSVSEDIKMELSAAKVYAEGRGIRIEVKNETVINDIKELINVKLAN
ncbi:MAG: DUF3788 domain-containing protein [Tannerella sp.]|jgi:hypothetical protein|nr:DUF3788 domain-containing protein [Tannerella sp.]